MVTDEFVLTVDEVNQRLPLVRSIVRDIMELDADLTLRRQRLRDLRQRHPSKPKADPVYEAEVQAMELDLKRDELRLNGFTDELRQIGGELTCAARGIVDFAADQDGDRIALCWKFDEPELMAWHATACGDNARLPLDLLPDDSDVFGQANLFKG